MRTWFYLPVIGLTACMVSPADGLSITSERDQVAFIGAYPARSELITLESSASRSGPFTRFATARSTTTPYPGTRPEAFTWSTRAAIPTWSGSGCTREAFVQARDSGGYRLATFDAAGVDCLFRELRRADIATATSRCLDDGSPIVRVTAGGDPFHVGDVVVASQVDADALSCVTRIDGSLTIDGAAAGSALSLPALVEVTGGVTVHYDVSGSGSTFEARPIALPVLTTIGGDLTVRLEEPAAYSVRWAIGLDALTSLGGHLSIIGQTRGATLNGLNALTRLDGDFTLDVLTGDFTGAHTLRNVTGVAGTVTFSNGGMNSWFLRATFIGGDLAFTGGTFAGNLESLETIGGDIILRSADARDVRHWPALRSVAGTLDAERSLRNLSVGDVTGLTLGGLRLHDNPLLTALTSTYIDVAPSGSITITSNPGITDCAAEAWVDSIAWPGTPVISGNGPC